MRVDLLLEDQSLLNVFVLNDNLLDYKQVEIHSKNELFKHIINKRNRNELIHLHDHHDNKFVVV